MKVECVWEHNGDDTLLYAIDFPGAYSRGASKDIAISKMEREVFSYLKWKGLAVPERITAEIVQESSCSLDVCDADSDVLFDTEKLPLTYDEYNSLKELVLK
ncbi:MAG: hypothetical protein ACI4QR_04935, partial [Eubacteriales bacterium]